MSKLEADGTQKIPVTLLKKLGGFSKWWSGTVTWTSNYSGNMGSAYVELCVNGEDRYLRISHTKREQKISLTTTPCHYGGDRFWFLCTCGRRVGTLYLWRESFACRHCHNLTYSTRNESRKYRRFVSSVDIDKQEEKVGYKYYRGVPTKKYAKFLQMCDSFNYGIIEDSVGSKN